MADETFKTNDARAQLNLILSFFSRVDSKLSTILAIDTGMLAAMAAKVPSLAALSTKFAAIPGVAVILIVASYCFLYRGGFPNLKGGEESLIYFREIAKRREVAFIDEYQQQRQEDIWKDLLSQIWRNSVILAEKFRCLRLAFISMALAIVPWSLTILYFSATAKRP